MQVEINSMLCLAVHNCEIVQHTHVPYVVLICQNARHSPDPYSLLKYEISTQVLLYFIVEKSGRKQLWTTQERTVKKSFWGGVGPLWTDFLV